MANSILILLQDQHRRIRAASRGARVSLLNACNGFTAILGCAVTIRDLAGPIGEYKDLGEDDLCSMDEIPTLFVPYSDMFLLMSRLEGHASVALLDRAQHRTDVTVFEAFLVQPMGPPKSRYDTLLPEPEDDGLDDLMGEEDDGLSDLE